MTIRPDCPPIVDAARDGDEQAVRTYLADGADADSADVVERTALFHAACAGHEGIVKLLLERNADANMEDDDGETPFIAALEGKHFGIAALLLEASADINMISGRQQQTPLHWAFNMDLREETTERVLWLLEQGAEPTRKNVSQLTVLGLARERSGQFPFAGEMLEQMREFIRTHEPAYILAQQMKQASAEMCDALRDGLPGDVAMKPIRLKLAPKSP